MKINSATIAGLGAVALAVMWLKARSRPDERTKTTDGATSTAEQQRLAGMRGWFALQQAQQQFQQTQAQAEMQANLQRTYLEARTALETSANLDAGAKATAIEAMSKWYSSQVLAPIRATYGSPDAWPTAGGGTTQPSAAQTTTITDLYREILGRDPDPSGIATYTAAMANGMTADQLRAILANSDEARNRPAGETATPAPAPSPATTPAPVPVDSPVLPDPPAGRPMLPRWDDDGTGGGGG